MTDDRDLARLLGRLADDGRDRPDPAEHPSNGTLSFYHARKLLPEEEGWVREHLVECKRCRDLLLEYAEFMEDEEEEKPEGVADFGAAADWQRLRGVAVVAEGAKRVDRAYEPGTPRSFFRSLKTAYSLAAVLAVAVVGLYVYSANLRWERDQPDLDPEPTQISDSTRSADKSGKVIEVSAREDKHIFFDLPVPDEETSGEYRLEIYLEDKRIFGPREIKKKDQDFFPVVWRSSGLKSGRYEFKIYREGKSDPVGQYPFTVIKR